MRDYIDIGSTPCDEDCAQVGSGDYRKRARVELQAFVNQLYRQFGNGPDGAELRVKAFPHDFGTYHEVVAYFDDTLPLSIEWAFKVENECPESWDDEARAELGDYAPDGS